MSLMNRASSEAMVICPFCHRAIFSSGSDDGRSYGPYECLRCGHIWSGKKRDPLRCPKCGSSNWNTKPTSFECLRCSYVWTSRREGTPFKCPRCQSSSWNEESEQHDDSKAGYNPLVSDNQDRIIELHDRGIGIFQIAIGLDIPLLEVLSVYRCKGWPVRLQQ